MPLSFSHHSATALLFCASILGAFSDTCAAVDFASPDDESAPPISGISPKYLPAYSPPADGVSWAGHVDSELFTNLSGGIQRGSTGHIVGQFGVSYDTQKAGFWKGGKFTLSLMGIYNSAAQQDYSGDIQTASNIWAPDALRFYDAAFRQHWTNWLSTRVGYMDVNYDFDVTTNALQLINSSFGMTPTITVNVPGTPTYPYSGLGFLVEAHNQHLSSRIAIFQGDPRHQTSAFTRGYMALWEGDLRWDGPKGGHRGVGTEDNGRYILKVGAWHYQQSNPHRYGLSPTTSGVYAIAEGNWDWSDERQIGAFAQLGGAPQTLNPVPWYLGLGLRLSHPFVNRPDDSLSIGMARAWLRPDSAADSLGVAAERIQHAETAYEATYVARLTEHVTLQPDLQYIQHPGGHHPNATVGMMRVHIEFF
ncbi:carbohydrate porin [Acidithiobacillus ferrianus]|uniref:Carbohydrate porin n=2 Tax=Acidithiobacillus ferrianus TaxID=2678518 RepID=A0A845UDN3_9PROT|nr:carbohydrate porin [Acidithiobacillus ferrianus]NDU43877.1 carbohydrate porin [Acidithiobacillus ferrianus]